MLDALLDVTWFFEDTRDDLTLLLGRASTGVVHQEPYRRGRGRPKRIGVPQSFDRRPREPVPKKRLASDLFWLKERSTTR